MRAVIYTRVSTDEQNPRSQLNDVLDYAYKRGYYIVKVFEENISGSIDPFNRPVFTQMLDYIINNNIEVIVMYDLTRFYRAKSPIEALNKLRIIIDKYQVLIDFAREPEIEDPLMRELWMFLKSWFATYERLQASIRTKYGMARLKKEGKLYHKPSLAHYYAAWLYNKGINEITKVEVDKARKRLREIISKYWNNSSIKKSEIINILVNKELRDLYIKFPKAPKSYISIYRLMKNKFVI